MGYPGATTASYGYDTRGRKIELHAENLSTGWGLNHSAAAFFADCDGDGKLPGTHCKMDGWNKKRESNDAPDAARANDPATDAFDYRRPPRAFKKIAGSRPSSYWMQLQRSERARDGAPIIGDE
jgi:hypothetical protein